MMNTLPEELMPAPAPVKKKSPGRPKKNTPGTPSSAAVPNFVTFEAFCTPR